MKSLITKKEETALKKMLAWSPSPEATLSFHELRGFIYGLAITPEIIHPDEWVPLIFGEDSLEPDHEESIRESIDTMFNVLNKHMGAFYEGSLFLPFSMNKISESDVEAIFEWTSGFEEALSLRPAYWEEQQALTPEQQDQLMNSLIVIEGIVYPEDAMDMFVNLPAEELSKIGVDFSDDENGKILQIQMFMLHALELSVETIQNHAFSLDRRRREEASSKKSPSPLTSSLPERDKTAGFDNGQKGKAPKKKGKVIQVEFPKHGKRKAKTKIRKLHSNGQSFQLAISLAYTDPEIWRRVEVPDSFSLAELHTLIQLVMGWQDSHLHNFQAGKRVYGPQLADDYLNEPILDESRFSLSDLQNELLQGMLYTYDFGDNWEHVVLLEKVSPRTESRSIPVVLDGANACPPEDIGGVAVYQEFLEFLGGSGDEELMEIFNTEGFNSFDPTYFDKNLINKVLRSWFGENGDS